MAAESESAFGLKVRAINRFHPRSESIKKADYYPWYPCVQMPYSAPIYKTFSTLADVKALESEVLPIPNAYKPTYRKSYLEATSLKSSTTRNPSSASSKKSIPKIVFSSLPTDVNKPQDRSSASPLVPKLVEAGKYSAKKRPTSRPKFASVPQGFNFHYPEAELRFTPESNQEGSESGKRCHSNLSRSTRSSSRISGAILPPSRMKERRKEMVDKQVDTHDTNIGQILFCRVNRPVSPILQSDVESRKDEATVFDESEESGNNMLSRSCQQSSAEDWLLRSSSTLSEISNNTSMTMWTQDDDSIECLDKSVMATLDEEEEGFQEEDQTSTPEEVAPKMTPITSTEEERKSTSSRIMFNNTIPSSEEVDFMTRWEPILYRNYDEARMAYGWEMEVPHDPYGIKSHYLPKRLPVAVSIPAPEVLPPEPILQKVNKSTFFHVTQPQKSLSFTLDPSFSSERFNARKNELIRRGLWKFSAKSFSFVY